MTMNDQKLSVLLQWLEECKNNDNDIDWSPDYTYYDVWRSRRDAYLHMIDKVNELLQTPSVD